MCVFDEGKTRKKDSFYIWQFRLTFFQNHQPNQLRPEVLEELKQFMTFLIILEIMDTVRDIVGLY